MGPSAVPYRAVDKVQIDLLRESLLARLNREKKAFYFRLTWNAGDWS